MLMIIEITLVTCFSKIFTVILNKRMNSWIEDNNIVSDVQFGFRKGRSTIDAVFVLSAIVSKILSENDRLACAFIDLSKAFAGVYRNGLWYKLIQLGITGKMLRIIRDMYSRVKARVRGCKSYSDFLNVQ